MTIQILTINLNNLNGLRKSCDSVIQFAMKHGENIHWIIKDGESKDGSIAYLDELKAMVIPKNIELNILIQPDKGIFNGMNQAIDVSKDNLLTLFLNSGDYLSNEFTNSFHVNDFVDSEIVYGDYFKNSEEESCREKSDPNLDFAYVLSKMINHQSIFINSKFLKKYLFKEEYWVNADWVQLFEIIRFNELRIKYLGYSVSVYELGGNSGKYYNEGIEQRVKYFKSNYTLEEIKVLTNFARMRQRSWYSFLLKSLESPKRSIILNVLTKITKFLK